MKKQYHTPTLTKLERCSQKQATHWFGSLVLEGDEEIEIFGVEPGQMLLTPLKEVKE